MNEPFFQEPPEVEDDEDAPIAITARLIGGPECGDTVTFGYVTLAELAIVGPGMIPEWLRPHGETLSYIILDAAPEWMAVPPDPGEGVLFYLWEPLYPEGAGEDDS